MIGHDNQHIAILGANSFLARNLYIYLVTKTGVDPNSIFLYDKDPSSFDRALNYQMVDFFDEDSIRKINFECSVLYIFIGKTGTVRGFNDYKSFININEIVLLNILSIHIEKKSTAKIVYPSTRLVYRGNTGRAVSEEAEKCFNSIYAITKFSAENYLTLYSDIFKIPVCILRIGVPYGTMIPDNGSYGTFGFFTEQAKSGKNITIYGDGSIIKTYTHIEDICQIMFDCGSTDISLCGIFNIGGDNKSLQEIGRLIADKYGVGITNIPWPEIDLKVDGGTTILDSSKLDAIFNYVYHKIDKNIG